MEPRQKRTNIEKKKHYNEVHVFLPSNALTYDALWELIIGPSNYTSCFYFFYITQKVRFQVQ